MENIFIYLFNNFISYMINYFSYKYIILLKLQRYTLKVDNIYKNQNMFKIFIKNIKKLKNQ